MKYFFFSAALAAFACSPLAAQQQKPASSNPPAGQGGRGGVPLKGPAVWQAELPGGSFVVALMAIRDISLQQYILDGAARVTEVNVDVGGTFKPRFYYLEPLGTEAMQALPGGQSAADHAQAEGQNIVNRVVPGDPIWAKVVKNYPTTTHAGTIEFRLETRDQLDKLYASIEHSWTTGKGGVFTPAGTTAYRAPKKDDDQDASSMDNAPDPTGSSGGGN